MDQNPIPISWPFKDQIITAPNGISYKIGNRINEGAYAQVYEGVDDFFNPVAIKIFKPANRPFGDVEKQWKAESDLFIKLRHPNVVAIYNSFIFGNLFYIILERAWGNIFDWINSIQKNGTIVTEETVVEIARQLLFAIDFFHKENVLHRDLTVYNTLVFEGPINRGATFKISDFGISKHFIEPWQPHISRTTIAHPSFIPPELLLPEYGYTTEQSDLYHLGLILLYALTNNLIIDERMDPSSIKKMILDGHPRMIAETINSPVGNFIAVLLRRHQEYRFKTALDAWKILRDSVIQK